MIFKESSTEYDVSQRVNVIRPPDFGWLEYKLNNKELDHVWKCIENKGVNVNAELAGNISGSYQLEDTDNWFFNNSITPLIKTYSNKFTNMGATVPVFGRYPYTMATWWVNYQKQHEFNPAHRHTGVYSFVIWLKIPYDWRDQNKDYTNNTPSRSTFEFTYSNIMGRTEAYPYNVNQKHEGTLLFFPSELRHQVYPFFNCNEDRISVSGNIYLDAGNQSLDTISTS